MSEYRWVIAETGEQGAVLSAVQMLSADTACGIVLGEELRATSTGTWF